MGFDDSINHNPQKKENIMNIRDLEDCNVLRFYPYPHSINDRIMTIKDNGNAEFTRYYNELRNHLIEKYNDCTGKNCEIDNKIVFKVSTRFNNTVFYIGFYDWNISIGFNVVKY